MINRITAETNELFKAYKHFIQQHTGYQISAQEYKDYLNDCIEKEKSGEDVRFNPMGLYVCCTGKEWTWEFERRMNGEEC